MINIKGQHCVVSYNFENGHINKIFISFESDTVRGDIFYEKGKIHFNDIPYYLMFEGVKELDKIIKQNINI